MSYNRAEELALLKRLSAISRRVSGPDFSFAMRDRRWLVCNYLQSRAERARQ